MKTNQKVVLITGASSGMGRATALYLSKQGFMVYAGSRTPEKLFNIESKNLHPIGLFGSFSRGEATKNSDVDIIFDFKENISDIYSVKVALKEYLSGTFNRSVGLAKKKYLKLYAKNAILKDVIYV